MDFSYHDHLPPYDMQRCILSPFPRQSQRAQSANIHYLGPLHLQELGRLGQVDRLVRVRFPAWREGMPDMREGTRYWQQLLDSVQVFDAATGQWVPYNRTLVRPVLHAGVVIGGVVRYEYCRALAAAGGAAGLHLCRHTCEGGMYAFLTPLRYEEQWVAKFGTSALGRGRNSSSPPR